MHQLWTHEYTCRVHSEKWGYLRKGGMLHKANPLLESSKGLALLTWSAELSWRLNE